MFIGRMNDLVRIYQPVACAITALIPGEVEVVVHDLTTGLVALVENARTPRTAGDPSMIDLDALEQDIATGSMIGPYTKFDTDGAKMKSVSALIMDIDKTPMALLCINLRVGAFDAASAILAQLTSIPDTTGQQPRSLIKNDWREDVNAMLHGALAKRKTSLAGCKKPDRIAILTAFDEAGIFDIRGSSDYVASVLNISRASVYELLRLARSASDKNPSKTEN